MTRRFVFRRGTGGGAGRAGREEGLEEQAASFCRNEGLPAVARERLVQVVRDEMRRRGFDDWGMPLEEAVAVPVDPRGRWIAVSDEDPRPREGRRGRGSSSDTAEQMDENLDAMEKRTLASTARLLAAANLSGPTDLVVQTNHVQVGGAGRTGYFFAAIENGYVFLEIVPAFF